MKHNKIIVILLAIVLLIGTFVSAANVGMADTRAQEETVPQQPGTTEIPTIPHVTVAGLDVGDTYYEVSLLVSARQFQTVGVVLSYDTSALTPIVWSSGEKDTDGESPKAVDLEGHTGWSNPVVLPSRGSDGLAGKPALCYQGYTSAEGTNEATPTGRAYLYLGADALEYTSLSNERAVTVRFRKEAAAGSITMPTADGDDPEDESFTISLAPRSNKAATEESIPGRPVLATTGSADVTLKSYLDYTFEGANTGTAVSPEEPPTQEGGTDETDTPEPGTGDDGTTEGEAESDRCILSFAKNPQGLESADSAGGGSGDYAITFFDWDGRVIDAIAAPQNATQAVTQWQSQKWIEERLGNKKGYTFDQWLIVRQEGGSLSTANGTFTSNDTPLDLSDSDVKEDVATPEFLSKLQETDKTIAGGPNETSKSLLLQAAYKANTDKGEYPEIDLINGGGTDTTDQYYTIKDPVYTRYGTGDAIAGSYSLTLTVTRERTTKNGDEVGVTRLREPAIWVAMTPTGSGNPANIMSLIRLENTDETTFEVVSTKQIAKVTCKVIDAYGDANWTGRDDKSDLTKSQWDGQTCIANGTRGYLAQQAFQVAYQGKSWDAAANNWACADACLRADKSDASTGADDRDAYTDWSTTRVSNAQTALVNKTIAVNNGVAEAERRTLTYGEVLDVLKGVASA